MIPRPTACVLLICCWSGQAPAADAPFSWQFNVGGARQNLQGSPDRSSLRGMHLFVGSSWLGRAGMTIGESVFDVNFSDSVSTGTEKQIFATAFVKLWFDGIPGTITARTDLYRLHERIRTVTPLGGGMYNTSITANRHEAAAIAVSYLPFTRGFIVGMEQARSWWTDYQVDQYDGYLGVGFNRLYDWLQARVIIGDFSTDPDPAGYDRGLSLRLSWTHWFQPGIKMPNKLSLTLQQGEELKNVDAVSGIIYSGNDILTRSGILSIEINSGKHVSLLLAGSRQHYNTVDGTRRYQGSSMYLNVNHDW